MLGTANPCIVLLKSDMHHGGRLRSRQACTLLPSCWRPARRHAAARRGGVCRLRTGATGLERARRSAALGRGPPLITLGIAAVQVTLVCVRRLLAIVRRGTVFSHAAFRYVDVIFWAGAAASVLVFALAVMLAPGDAAPGVVLLICGASLLVAGVVLIVLVLRVLHYA
jgi:hypothetical protein